MASVRVKKEAADCPPALNLSIRGAAEDAARKRAREDDIDPTTEPTSKKSLGPREKLLRFVVASRNARRTVGDDGTHIDSVSANDVNVANQIPDITRNDQELSPLQSRSTMGIESMTSKVRDEEITRLSPQAFLVGGQESLSANVSRIISNHEKSLQKEVGEAIRKKLEECEGACDFFSIKEEIDFAIEVIQHLRVDASHLNQLIEPLWEEARVLVSRSEDLGRREAKLRFCEELMQYRMRVLEKTQGHIRVKKEMLENDLKGWGARMTEIMNKL